MTKSKKAKPYGSQEYRGNGAHDWETVVGNTVRLRVPGGWLYGRRSTYDGSRIMTPVFVPTPSVVGYAI